MDQFVLHLASASPRRRDILNSLEIRHSYAGVDMDEAAQPGEQAGQLFEAPGVILDSGCRYGSGREPAGIRQAGV